MIIPEPKAAPFNLSLEDQGENARIVLALNSLKGNSGWQFLMQVFRENKAILSDMIIEKIDQDGNPITEVQADEARFKYKYLDELMKKPDFYLKKLAPQVSPMDELDPYDQGDGAH